MIEIAAGLIVIAGTIALALGFVPVVLAPFTLGLGGVLIGSCLGLTLLGHGLYAKAHTAAADDDRYWLRTTGLMRFVVLIIIVFAVALPLATAPLGLVKIAGFPLNYYVAAQGALVALVIVMFLFTRRQHAIEREQEGAHEETAP